jgi:hypothetical protein
VDTVEELNGTYYYHGMERLNAQELLLWIFVDETVKQLGVDDVAAVVSILLGWPLLPTRRKFKGATEGTSVLSLFFRRYVNTRLSRPYPTLTLESIKNFRFAMTNRLGAVVGRTIPVVGWVVLASDVAQITYRSLMLYNTIARNEDRLL